MTSAPGYAAESYEHQVDGVTHNDIFWELGVLCYCLGVFRATHLGAGVVDQTTMRLLGSQDGALNSKHKPCRVVYVQKSSLLV